MNKLVESKITQNVKLDKSEIDLLLKLLCSKKYSIQTHYNALRNPSKEDKRNLIVETGDIARIQLKLVGAW
jgi:hypothetical protein